MDLRRYFTSNRNVITKKNQEVSSKSEKQLHNSDDRRKRKLVIESDSDEDTSKNDIPKIKENIKITPEKKKKGHNSARKHSEVSAIDVFSKKPIKRSYKKPEEVFEKIKETFKSSNKKVKIEDDDANFEAALVQLDVVGDNWVDWSETTNNNLKTVVCSNVTNKHTRIETPELQDSNVSDYFSDSVNSRSTFNSYENKNSDSSSGYNSVSLDTVDKLIIKNISKTIFEDPKDILKTTENEKLPERDKVVESLRSSHDNSLWVEKYKPQSSSKIIGQQGEKSNVKKLTDWLTNWYKNNAKTKKGAFVPSGWNKDPTGSCFRAALLSGPPGVGKTTTVSLVCKELGFDVVEFNASDTRSKKQLQDEVSRLLNNTSLTPYFFTEGHKNFSVSRKHALVMDEVDGMAGNEDRGGIQELIQLIKTTRVPIICMCNDRHHPKIRNLVNYCFDLRFSRPRIEQINGYMRTVCFKEKLNISKEALIDIVNSANRDIRLILNHLSMLAANKNSNLESASKYIKLGPWDVLRKVFSYEDHKTMSIHEKCDLFFFDYSLAPLFVQENYLIIKPINVAPTEKYKRIELFSRAANCISLGDRVDNVIRKNNAWSLLPTQAIFASYAPGEILEGYCSAQINFPSWLGKHSKQGRMDRLLQEIQIHTRLKISGSKQSVNLDYATHLRNAIVGPLMQYGTDGVKLALSVLHDYQLVKEDVESLQEICQWPNSVNLMTTLDSKVKAAFTRAYNKNPPIRPYSLTATVKKGRSDGGEENEMYEAENDDDAVNENINENDDAMIIKKKKQQKKKDDSGIPSISPKPTKKKNPSKRRKH